MRGARGQIAGWWLVGLLLACPAVTAASEEAYTPPEDLEDGWYARIETSMGRIVIQLLPEQAPQSVAYFVGLARGDLEWTDPVTGEVHQEPYYDNTPVFKAEAGLRFDLGDRSGTGRGAPQMFVPMEGHGPVNFHHGYRVGRVRRAGARMSAVQFFITAGAAPWFTGKQPCFGRVISGQETVFDITQVKTYSNHRPIEPVMIEKIAVFTVGHAPELETPRAYQPKLRDFGRKEDSPPEP